jgi:hypothetical protein
VFGEGRVYWSNDVGGVPTLVCGVVEQRNGARDAVVRIHLDAVAECGADRNTVQRGFIICGRIYVLRGCARELGEDAFRFKIRTYLLAAEASS